MKATTSALLDYLAAARGTDAPLVMADCYTVTLASGSLAGIADGTVLTYTDLDVPVALNGFIYAANAVLIEGLRYKATIGVNVDTQQITLSADPSMTVGGVPFLQAVQQGLLDGAEIQRDRAFFAAVATPPLVPIGSILLFRGRVAAIDTVGRRSAKISVNSDLNLLAVDFPRRLFQSNCTHVLYDGGCRASRPAFTFAGAVAAGSTQGVIVWAGAAASFSQGSLTFLTGPNTGVEVTIKTGGSGSLALTSPLPNAPQIGDTFSASFGCDHTIDTCDTRFTNKPNFLGFPFLPPPQIIVGPLSATSSTDSRK